MSENRKTSTCTWIALILIIFGAWYFLNHWGRPTPQEKLNMRVNILLSGGECENIWFIWTEGTFPQKNTVFCNNGNVYSMFGQGIWVKKL